MAKEYLKVNNQLIMVDGKLIEVPAETDISDALDEQNEIIGATQDQADNTVNQITGYIDGSPRGAYTSLSALQSAYPTGAVGVYVTTDNGHWYYWNGSWLDGGVYQANGIADGSVTLNKLDDEIQNDLYANTTLYNLIPHNNLITSINSSGRRWFCGKQLPPKVLIKDIGLDISVVSGNITINVEFWKLNNENLVLDKSVSCVCNVVTGFNIYSEQKFDINYTTKDITYICVNIISNTNSSNKMAIVGDSTGCQFIDNTSDTTLLTSQLSDKRNFDIGVNLKYYVSNVKKINGIHFVKKDGTGDFTSISDACLSANEGDTIVVFSGVYNETINIYKKMINIIGIDRNSCVIYSNDGSYYNPPLYMTCGSVQNLSIIVEHTADSPNVPNTNTTGAYGIHIDDEYGENKSMLIKDCYIRSDFFPALGIGTRANCKIIIENCELENGQDDLTGGYVGQGSLGALFFHDSAGTDGKQEIIIKNTSMKSNLKNALCIMALTDGTSRKNKCYATFLNCNLYSSVNGKTNNIWFRNIETQFGGNIKLNPISDGNNNDILNGE